jgi:hypothetical protein
MPVTQGMCFIKDNQNMALVRKSWVRGPVGRRQPRFFLICRMSAWGGAGKGD